MALENASRRLGNGGPVGDVAQLELPTDLGREAPEHLLAARHEHAVPALGCEQPCRRLADARGRTGHDGDPGPRRRLRHAGPDEPGPPSPGTHGCSRRCGRPDGTPTPGRSRTACLPADTGTTALRPHVLARRPARSPSPRCPAARRCVAARDARAAASAGSPLSRRSRGGSCARRCRSHATRPAANAKMRVGRAWRPCTHPTARTRRRPRSRRRSRCGSVQRRRGAVAPRAASASSRRRRGSSRGRPRRRDRAPPPATACVPGCPRC